MIPELFSRIPTSTKLASLLRELNTVMNGQEQKPQSDRLQEEKTVDGVTQESWEGSGYVRDSRNVVRKIRGNHYLLKRAQAQ